MATFLRKFATQSDYEAATLTQPCVSLISDMYDVKFDHIPAKAILTYDNGLKYVKHCDAWPDLTKYDITPSGYDYTKVTDAVVGDCVNELTNTFQQFYSLTSVTIPNSVSAVGATFTNCISLTDLELPSSITQFKNYQLFYGCSALTAVTIWAETPPSCNYPALLGADNANVYVPRISLSAYKTATNWSQYADRIFPIPYAFEGYYSDGTSKLVKNLDSTTLGIYTVQERYSTSSQDETRYTGMTDAFVGGNVATIGSNAFKPNSHGTMLSSVTLGDSVTTISDSAFAEVSTLKEINIGSGVTSIGQFAFMNCTGLTTITITATTPPTIDSSFTFYNCSSLATIYVPADSVSAYQAAWSDLSSIIQAIS